MKTLALTCAALAMSAFVAPAFAGTVENAIGNTVLVKSADGATTVIKLKADGTLSRTTPDGKTATGSWSNAGGKYCETFAGAQDCPMVPPDKTVGGSWTDKDAKGNVVTVTIAPGQ